MIWYAKIGHYSEIKIMLKRNTSPDNPKTKSNFNCIAKITK